MSGFIVKVRHTNGVAAFYTGRAGDHWFSVNRAEAFVYQQELAAIRRAAGFQHVHLDRTFMVDYADPGDGHAAGAAAMSAEMCGG